MSISHLAQPCRRGLAGVVLSALALLLSTSLVLAQGAAPQSPADVLMQHPHHVTPVAPPPQVDMPGQSDPSGHGGHNMGAAQRELVRLPAPMREHMLANMRDHLAAIGEIQLALAEGAYDQAAKVAEQRLGMSSLASHGADHMAPLMPAAMREHGSAMHRAASQFAVQAQNSSASGDLGPALAALARITSACVGCHAAYRVQ